MFSKEESIKIRKEFWVSYGKSFPRKWVLYNTQIKGFSFKFVADQKKAMVCLDIESNDKGKNELLFEQILELKNLLIEDYLPEVIFDNNYINRNTETFLMAHMAASVTSAVKRQGSSYLGSTLEYGVTSRPHHIVCVTATAAS